jgi:hypothetical protein
LAIGWTGLNRDEGAKPFSAALNFSAAVFSASPPESVDKQGLTAALKTNALHKKPECLALNFQRSGQPQARGRKVNRRAL